MGGPKLTDEILFSMHETLEWAWRQDLPPAQRARYLRTFAWIELRLQERGYTVEYSRLHAADSEKSSDP